jgi:hypothetical protein
MPDHLKTALMNHRVKHNPKKTWWVAMPTIMASLMVAVIFWPNSESIMTDFQTASAPDMMEQEQTIAFDVIEPLEEGVVAAKPLPKVVSEVQPAPEPKMSRSAAEKSSKEEPLLSNDAGLALSEDSASTLSMESEVSELVYSLSDSDVLEDTLVDEKSADFALVEADRAALPENPEQIWQVIDGPKGQFKDCEGQDYSMNITTDFETGVWVKVIKDEQNQIILEELSTYPCKPKD